MSVEFNIFLFEDEQTLIVQLVSDCQALLLLEAVT